MATLPIPQGATLQPLQQEQSVPIPQGATLQPLSTNQTQPEERPEMYNPQRSPMDFIASAAGPAYALMGNPDVREFGKQMLQKATNPEFLLGATGAGMLYNQGKQLYSIAKGERQPQTLAAAAGAVGVDPESVKRNAETQNYPGLAADAVFPILSMKVTGKLGEAAASTPGAYMAARIKPQVSTVPGMAKMAPHEVMGLEDIYRAAAPTGKNQGFRANLNAALPDLKAVAQDLNLKESKGGIINPDMRVRATVDALNARLESIAKNERVAQIQRNAGTPVEIKLSTDARRGMEFLATSAGESATQQLAASALKRGALPIEQADVLAQAANKYLKGYEKLTSDQKLSATVTSPKIGGLKELDKSLGNSLNNTLTSKGEVGLRDYERRYAGLSAVRDALQDRMNAAELEQPGIVKGLVRPVAGALMKGKTGIASASQAAVADIRTGKALQSGFDKLRGGMSATGGDGGSFTVFRGGKPGDPEARFYSESKDYASNYAGANGRTLQTEQIYPKNHLDLSNRAHAKVIADAFERAGLNRPPVEKLQDGLGLSSVPPKVEQVLTGQGYDWIRTNNDVEGGRPTGRTWIRLKK